MSGHRATTTANNQLESVGRVVRVLDCFSHETPELRLTDISAATGMSKTQVLRIATSLEASGYLARDEVHKRYRLGIRLFQLGSVVRDQMDIRRLARPHLERLVQSTHESARLVVARDPEPVCVDLIQTSHGVRLHAQLGDRLPWHAGASGPVILAFLPESEREEILSRKAPHRFTQHTVTDVDQLRQVLGVIRESGYHVNDRGDLLIDSRGVAAPVFDDNGRVLGTIGVGVPASRWQPANVARCTEAVVQAAGALSADLGFHPTREDNARITVLS